MIKNYMETLVDDLMKTELEEQPEKYVHLCQCPHCLTWAKADALNHLTPFYVTCVAGEVFGQYFSKEQQNMSDVLVAVAKGLTDLSTQDPYHHTNREI